MSNHKLVKQGAAGKDPKGVSIPGRFQSMSGKERKAFFARVLAFALAFGMLAMAGLAAAPSTTGVAAEAVQEGP